ncbi:MAG: NPCBM/NEW2 domain-containing protein, partial [Planctomycetes bacterium]|nr:NPCBM/NEW2 domain-containing protein [Planctomycetota bacterium]
MWPMLRTLPDDTHASLRGDFPSDGPGGEWRIRIDGELAPPERPRQVSFDGFLTIESGLGEGMTLTRSLFAASYSTAAVEELRLRNDRRAPVLVDVDSVDSSEHWPVERTRTGPYVVRSVGDTVQERLLAAGEELVWERLYLAQVEGVEEPTQILEAAVSSRRGLCDLYARKYLVLETPEPEFDAAFAFAKLRAVESIFRTEGGLMHAPGGTRYYAAIWANDTVEYAAPFFPYLGAINGNSASWNALRHFARFMNPDFEMLPSSIIAEGRDVWMGAGDRGDAAMIAYGASRFALSLGEREVAEELWPLIEWCLEYCRRRTTADGVIASDRDELEGRLPHGRTNLNTSMMTYGGLIAAARLARSLDKGDGVAQEYEGRAAELRRAVESSFGAEIDGFETYRYHEDSEVLRSWICVPLTMGVFERRQGTLDALFSDRMWTADGLKSIATDDSFWDRSTLYGLRGAFAAGDTERALAYFRAYTRRRLLGDHVPYAVEAWPEGNQRHLSAESALYARVVTEGLFGVEPLALDTFAWTPRLPADWDHMSLRRMHGFGTVFDLEVRREADGLRLRVVGAEGSALSDEIVTPGTTLEVPIPASHYQEQTWLVVEPNLADDTPPGHRWLSDEEAALGSQEWGTLRRGRSVEGRPMKIRGRMYTRGFGTHAESEVPWFHDGSAAIFSGLVGIDDEVAIGASAEFQIWNGESMLWSSGVVGRDDPAQMFHVDLEGLHVVYLRVTDGGDGNSYDHADWVELEVRPDPEAAVRRHLPPMVVRMSADHFGLQPDDGVDDSAALRRALAAARDSLRNPGNAVTLVLPPGRYDFHEEHAVARRWFISNHDNGPLKRVAVPLCGFRGLIIEATGAELIGHGRVLPLGISDCQDLEIRGLAIDFERPHHSQATVVAVEGDRVELAIGPDYPYAIEDGQLIFTGGSWRHPVWRWSCMEFEAGTGRIAFNTGDQQFRGTAEELAHGRVRVTGFGFTPAVGNQLVLRHGGRPHPGIFLQRSRGVRFRGVTVHQAEGMGWLAQRSADISIEGGGVHLRPDDPRVFTTSADATHFSNCSGTITVEKALFEGMMDDAINVHGTYLQVQALEDGGAVRAKFMHGQSTGFEFALPGERIAFVRRATLLPYAEAEVADLKKVSDTEVLLRFEGGPPEGLQPGDGLENLDAAPEVSFRGNVVRNNRARGALFSSPRRTVVEDNLFDHSSGSAILLAGDCNGWFESGACREVTIRRNRFVNNLTSLYQFTEAVISICPEVPALDAQERPYHADVRIEDNDFTVFDAPLLFARSVDGLVFRGNRVRRSDEYPPFHPNQERVRLEGCRGAAVDPE